MNPKHAVLIAHQIRHIIFASENLIQALAITTTTPNEALALCTDLISETTQLQTLLTLKLQPEEQPRD